MKFGVRGPEALLPRSSRRSISLPRTPHALQHPRPSTVRRAACVLRTACTAPGRMTPRAASDPARPASRRPPDKTGLSDPLVYRQLPGRLARPRRARCAQPSDTPPAGTAHARAVRLCWWALTAPLTLPAAPPSLFLSPSLASAAVALSVMGAAALVVALDVASRRRQRALIERVAYESAQAEAEREVADARALFVSMVSHGAPGTHWCRCAAPLG